MLITMNQQKIIQNYEVLRPLGEGGMGEVWLAKHTLLPRQAAIKSLHPQLLKNESVRVRFKNEAATLAKLQHRNIVALLDYTEDHEGAYLIMEYVDGRDLSDYITEINGPIVEPQLTDLFGQILEGFEYAHSKKIVHRDIKPSNFIITSDGTVKVLDFGIAKMLDEVDMSLTKTGTRMGTVLYMSPEQVRGEPVDERSDIYSLGVTLFQMATGQCPYDSNTTEFHVYNQIVNDELPAATTIYPGVSAGIESLIRKATSKNPANRFQNCGEFLAALRNTGSVPDPNRTRVDLPPPTDIPVASVPPPAPASTRVVPPVSTPAAPSGEATATATAPQAPPEDPPRKNRIPMIIGGGILVIILVLAAVFLIPQGDDKSDKMYVIASGLFIRSEPYMDSDKLDKLPFREAVEVKKDLNSEWIEIEHKGVTGYLAKEYLATYEEFILLDNLTHTVEGNEAINGSFHKIALRDYFKKNSLHIDLPEDEYLEYYGQEKDDSKIWLAVDGIPAMKLEKGKYPKTQRRSSAVIIGNKADPQKQRLVTFRHFKDGTSVDVGSLDVSEFDTHPIREITLKNFGGYYARDYEEARAINADLKNGKEGIILGGSREFGDIHLITWIGTNDLNVYKLSERGY